MLNRNFTRLTALMLAGSMLVLTGCQQQIGDTRMATETESEIVVTTAPEAATVDAVAALASTRTSFRPSPVSPSTDPPRTSHRLT